MVKAFKDMLRACKIADFNTTQSNLRESAESERSINCLKKNKSKKPINRLHLCSLVRSFQDTIRNPPKNIRQISLHLPVIIKGKKRALEKQTHETSNFAMKQGVGDETSQCLHFAVSKANIHPNSLR